MKLEQEQLQENKFLNVPLNYSLKKQYNFEELKYKYITSLNEINQRDMPLKLPPIANKHRSVNTPQIDKKKSYVRHISQLKDQRLLNTSQKIRIRDSQPIDQSTNKNQSLRVSNLSFQLQQNQQSSFINSQFSSPQSFKVLSNQEQFTFNQDHIEQEKKLKLNILYQDQEYEQVKEIKKKLEEEKSKFGFFIEDLDKQYEQKKAKNSNETIEEGQKVLQWKPPQKQYSLYNKQTTIIKLNKQLHQVKKSLKQFIAYEKQEEKITQQIDNLQKNQNLHSVVQNFLEKKRQEKQKFNIK